MFMYGKGEAVAFKKSEGFLNVSLRSSSEPHQHWHMPYL